MEKNISIYIRKRIVHLNQIGWSAKKIQEKISQEDKVLISRQGISYTIKRYKETGTFADRKRSGRKPRKEIPAIKKYIDQQLEQDYQPTAREIQTNLSNQGHEVSVATVKRLRCQLGWSWRKTKFVQMIREANKKKRMDFCLKCLWGNDKFEDVIFTDESTIKMETSLSYSFQKEDGIRRFVGKPKHPYSVHVWGGISNKGPTPLVIFTGIMKKEFYQQEIILKTLKPFIERSFPQGHRFQQDNDPKHTAKETARLLVREGINHWPTPPESPDLNPIENVWGAMKHYICSKVKPRTKDELVSGIKTYWSTLTPAACQNYIRHLYKVVPAVIQQQGAASGY